MIKKFIRGNKEREAEVIKALENLGGVNTLRLTGSDPDGIYSINTNNDILKFKKDRDYAIIVQECFEEIKLPEKKVITNLDVVKWYFHMLREGHAVQFMNCDRNIHFGPLPYLYDDGKTTIEKVRIDFGEWMTIEEAGINKIISQN